MANKKDGRSVPRKTLEQYRFRAVKLRKKGWKAMDIAESLGMHPGTVSNWFTKKKYGGNKALKLRKAKGATPKLSKNQMRTVLNWIKSPASAFGFDSDLWDCKRIQTLIKERLKIGLHMSNVWRLLRGLMLTRQKPEKRAIQQNKHVVEHWLQHDWPKIREHARRWQALVYFVDEAGVSLIPTIGTTWAPKGKTPIIRVTGKKGGVCVTSAISPAGRMVFRIEKGRIKAKQHIEFLQQALKHHPRRKIIAIEDNSKPHTAKTTMEFARKNRRRFAPYHIPPYSPELNPDEKTWRQLKKHELRVHMAKTTNGLRSVVLSKMKSIQRRPSVARSFFIDAIII